MKECSFCYALTPEQIIHLATPTYQIRKERKAKADKQMEFIDPADVTVISAIGSNSNNKETLSSELRSHFQQDSSFKQELVGLKDKWVAKFARIEALLTKGTHQPSFSPVRMHVPHPPPIGAVSRSPFLQPSTSDSSLPAGSARVQDKSPSKILHNAAAKQPDGNTSYKSPLQNLYPDRSPVPDQEQEPLF